MVPSLHRQFRPGCHELSVASTTQRLDLRDRPGKVKWFLGGRSHWRKGSVVPVSTSNNSLADLFDLHCILRIGVLHDSFAHGPEVLAAVAEPDAPPSRKHWVAVR